MKNLKIIDKISQGMYVLTTKNGGCIVDAVSQISSVDNPLIAISVMKKNNTNLLLKNNEKFAISFLGKEVDPEIITTFGFNSSRDIDKFEKIKTIDINEIKIINNSLGYIICDKVDSIENETHTLFIGRVIEADLLKDEEPMTYQYYQENKENLLKIKTKDNKTAWICTVCGYIYYGNTMSDDYKCPICGVGKDLFKIKDNYKEVKSMKYECIACGYIYDEEIEGVKFEDLPDDWVCPLCGVGKDMFKKV